MLDQILGSSLCIIESLLRMTLGVGVHIISTAKETCYSQRQCQCVFSMFCLVVSDNFIEVIINLLQETESII